MKNRNRLFTLQLFAEAAAEGAPAASPAAQPAPVSTADPATPAAPVEQGLALAALCSSTSATSADPATPAATAPETALRTHFDALTTQAAALQKTFPGFSLEDELKNPVFLRMTAPDVNIPLADAYYALHHKELQAAAMQVTAQLTAQKLAASVQAGALRPDETGSAQAPSVTAFSYASASRRQREALKQKIRNAAALGKRIFP